MNKKLILASASPRRKEILDIAGYSYEAVTSVADELMGGVAPEELVRLNALKKAREVCSRLQNESVVLGADTVVCLDDAVLGKPNSKQQAFEMLKSLSGSTHRVLTGYAIVSGSDEKSGVCSTEVKFRTLSDEEINAYIETNEPMDKAGAYGIQERACLFAESVNGDYFNIIGLPISQICPVLREFGILPDWQNFLNKKPYSC